MNKFHIFDESKRLEVIRKIKELLSSELSVSVIYGLGSFFKGNSFHDIDIAVLLSGHELYDKSYEFILDKKCSDALRLECDLRILNDAPLPFVAAVLKANTIILDKDPSFRAGFTAQILSEYFDMLPFRNRYLKELKRHAA